MRPDDLAGQVVAKLVADSGITKFPLGKYREFRSSGPSSATIGLESRAKYNGLRPNSLRNGTGNLFRPSRELNRAIREFIRRIRDSYVGRDFIAT